MLTHADDVDLAVKVDVSEPYGFTEHGYVTATQNGHFSSDLRTSQFYGIQSVLVLSSHFAWRNAVVLMYLDIKGHILNCHVLNLPSWRPPTKIFFTFLQTFRIVAPM